MSISVFDLFSIGIGPSSSHTVGPMKAAHQFVESLHDKGQLQKTGCIKIELFGSLAFTGKGHGTDNAILLGLEGALPDTVNPGTIKPHAEEIIRTKTLMLRGNHRIKFDYLTDLIFNYKDLLPAHTNGMRYSAYDASNTLLMERVFYSIGGGFIIDENQARHSATVNNNDMPYPFDNAKSLLEHCEATGMNISQIMMANECSIRTESEVRDRLQHIFSIMRECIETGCLTPGILPGGLNLPRRAPDLYRKLMSKGKPHTEEHIDSIAWLNVFAIAVNEENAAGGRVVTAPTNGAAGIIPAVLNYYFSFYPQAKPDDVIDFLLTAGAIAILYKKGASISGADVGCQGEVGVACSMAAGALTAILGGTIYQIENAAEIAMEHHLGLTCDPINGLVQIPCIERNAMGSVKAVNASRLALLGDGKHYVSLDKVISTMKQTGKDMMTIYKETSLGGLAANLPEC